MLLRFESLWENCRPRGGGLLSNDKWELSFESLSAFKNRAHQPNAASVFR